MAKWKLVSGRMVVRDENDVRRSYRRGDEVELNEEQEQRLRAGQPGSQFQKPGKDEDEPEVEEIAVANEATLPAEDDGFAVSPAGTKNRRVPASSLPEAKPAESKREASTEGSAPAPTTSTRPSAKK